MHGKITHNRLVIQNKLNKKMQLIWRTRKNLKYQLQKSAEFPVQHKKLSKLL